MFVPTWLIVIVVGAILLLGPQLYTFLSREEAKHPRQRRVRRLGEDRLKQLADIVKNAAEVEPQNRRILVMAFTGEATLQAEIAKYRSLPVLVAHLTATAIEDRLRNDERERELQLAPAERPEISAFVHQEAQRMEARGEAVNFQ